MRLRSVWFGALALLLLATPLHAAGTVAVTTADVGNTTERFVRYTIDWTSTAGGAVSGNAISVRAGRLVSVRFVPDGGGTQPSDLYDVTLVDVNSVDVLAGVGANLSNAAATVQQWDPPYYLDAPTQTLDLVVANAGNAKGGLVILLVQVR